MFNFQCFPSGPYSTNAYLLYDKNEEGVYSGFIIDPSAGSFEKISSFIKNTLKIPAENFVLKKILLTHSHWDHIADVHLFQEKTKAPVFIHKEDAFNLKNPGEDLLPSPIKIRGTKNFDFLKEGDVFEEANFSLKVIETPGHSLGSVCFYDSKNQLLFSGDTLFKGNMGNTSFPFSDRKKMQSSLIKLSQLPAETLVLPGHGESTSISNESWLKNIKA